MTPRRRRVTDGLGAQPPHDLGGIQVVGAAQWDTLGAVWTKWVRKRT